MSQSRPKMVDVGRLAGVSAQTVSRYYTGKGYVGAETRERIESAIAQLNYQFNGSARNLRVNETRTIGVLVTGPSVYGTWSILQGLNEAAHDAGYALFTSWVEFNPADASTPRDVHEALDRFLSARVDGILISSPHPGIEDTLQRVWETVPIVILSGHAWPNADSATVDSYEAALLATRHLVELGHRRILHIAGPAQINEAQDREHGYRDALAEVAAAPLPVLRGDWSAQSGYEAGSGVDVRDFSAVFSGNDQMALGFMNALRRRGLVAPADYSIAGVDDMPDARHFAPPLTTVWMDFVELGRAGFRMLVERIATGERVPRHVIRPRLVVRESTARVTPDSPSGPRSTSPDQGSGPTP
jgi:DNA-binding LacI/PurR family transcriptional regulator